MNKAITDGLVFMPPAFAAGLDQWSRGDGTPGSDSYAGVPTAAFVPADPDFGGCLELQKVDGTQKLRFMGQTPILPGCYLRIRARIKAVSGNLPSVRIAAWAGGAGNQNLGPVPQVGPSVSLQQYGQIIEVSAIVGTGTRPGVDMPWGRAAIYGHFGLDLTGPNGGLVRIDDIEIEDVTSVFLRDILGWVDVRDYGAIGDGVTDDSAAFAAADTAASGQMVKVPAGTYFLNDNVTFENRVLFEGRVVMPDDKILALQQDFNLPAYIDAFGDEVLAFKKAFQALLNNAGHEGLDLGGRVVNVSAPIDMQAAVANRIEYAQRRHIRNGQFYVENSSAWDTDVFTSQASYSPNNPLELTNVVNVANIPVGSLIEGGGVGREVYVRAKNVAQQRITLSMPLYDAAGTQVFTFQRFKYILDFSGFAKLSKFSMSDIEFQCRGRASGIILAPEGLIFHIRDCFFTAPLNRAITSPGIGCQGMLIDRCQFLSNETPMRAQDRVSIALNANANDVKLRDNRITHFRHFAVIGGTSSIIGGNHWFQGDSEPEGVRTAGLILTSSHNRATIEGNYIDNCSIEWTNEHDQSPDFANEFSFSGLNIADNIFQAIDVAPWFRFFVIKPYGPGHFIDGLNMSGNIFRAIRGDIDRVEHVDTSFADLNYDRIRNVTVAGNMFNSVVQGIMNPVSILHTQNTPAETWSVNCAGPLPFGAYAQQVEAIVPRAKIKNAANVARYHFPYVATEQGPARDRVTLNFPEATSGTYSVLVRIDN